MRKAIAGIIIAGIMALAAPAGAVDGTFWGDYRGRMYSNNGCRPHVHYHIRYDGARKRTLRSPEARYAVQLEYRRGRWVGEGTRFGVRRVFRLTYRKQNDRVTGTRTNYVNGEFKCDGRLDLHYSENREAKP